MNKAEAKDTCQRISSTWNNKLPKEKTERSNVLNAYYGYFLAREIKPMRMAIDTLRLNSSYLPLIPDIETEYHKHQEKRINKPSQKINCFCCMDRGYVLMNINRCESITYCDLCPKGDLSAGFTRIDQYGNTVLTQRENALTGKVSEHADVDEIIKNNKKLYPEDVEYDETREVNLCREWNFSEEDLKMAEKMMKEIR